jgi:lipid-A-disaccharide synthase
MMIAGEVSGDLHGSGVVRELKRRLPGLKMTGVGGDLMVAEGMKTIAHISSLSVMGFVEVVRHIPVIRRIEEKLLRFMSDAKPEVVVLIDYPGFNIRFARKAKRQGARVLYYISPQVWAWNRSRVRKMRSLIDEMNVVFPFEVDLYRAEGMRVEFVGHPILERLEKKGDREGFFRRNGLDPKRPLLALLPGSRSQEIRHMLPVMAGSADQLEKKFAVQSAIGVSRGFDKSYFFSQLGGNDRIRLVENDTYGLMEHADAAVVTSGTATLETAWYGTPMVVVYKTSPLTFLIGRSLVKIPHIGLVNIVAGRQIVPELIQGDMSEMNVVAEIGRILSDASYADRVRSDLASVKGKLGSPGASARVAENIIALAGSG